MGGHNYVPRRLRVHTLMRTHTHRFPWARVCSKNSHTPIPQCYYLILHGLIFHKAPGCVRDSQGWAHTSPGCTPDCQWRSVLVPSATLPEETEMGKNGKKPDDPAKQCDAVAFHTASGSSCSTLLEIRTGERLLKRHAITGGDTKWPQHIWAWVIRQSQRFPCSFFFGPFPVHLKKYIYISPYSHLDFIKTEKKIPFPILLIFSIIMWLFCQGTAAPKCRTEVRLRICPRLEETRLAYQTRESSINTWLCGKIPLKLSSLQTCFWAVWNELGDSLYS